MACNAVYGVDELSPRTRAEGGGGGASPPADCSVFSDCESLVCDGGRCRPCSDDTDCSEAMGTRCDDGRCVLSGRNGQPCDVETDCISGHCPGDDGVCCDTLCDLECEACLASKTGALDGTCSLVDPTIAPDPDAECAAQDISTCGPNGSGCSGTSTSCSLYPPAVVCVPLGCTNDIGVTEGQCDGAGQCLGSMTTSCFPYVCDGDVCRTSCFTGNHCVTNYYCGTGNCVPKRPNGQACSGGNQCLSGTCVNGVCG
jgi:hypothetical protein